MSRRVFTVVTGCGALALLVGIGWWVFSPANLGTPPVHDAAVATTTNAAPGGASPNATAASGAARSDATPPHTPERRVRIRDETGEPVANAEVAFDLAEDLCEPGRLCMSDVEARLAAARHYRSASDGTVVLPTEAVVAFVLARAGERFGCGRLEFSGLFDAAPELVVAPDRTLHIAVVGPDATPRRDVPVEVTYQRWQGLTDELPSTELLPRTDADGLTTLWHAQTLPFWDRTDPAVGLRALVLGAPTPRVSVRLGPPVPARIELACPDHGGIRVRAWVGAGAKNRLEVDPTIGEAGSDSTSVHWLPMPDASAAEWCLFPVALGRRWSVGPEELQLVEVVGPTRSGEEVAVDLRANARDSVTVLLLQPDGRPCAAQQILVTSDHLPWASSATTDANGRLDFCVSDTTFSFTAPTLRARAEVRAPAAEAGDGPKDLGIVTLKSPPELPSSIAGYVVDAVTGCPLQASLSYGSRKSGWRFASSSADGAFVLETTSSADIHASCADYASSQIQATAGTQDLVIAMQPLRTLRATVLVDPHIAIAGLGVWLRNGEDRRRGIACVERGRLRMYVELPDAESLELEVAVEGLPPVRRVPMREWVTAERGFTTTLDLRDALANVLVTVRKGDPQARGGSLNMRPSSGSAPWSRIALASRIAFAVPNGTTLDAIVEPNWGMCIRTTLQPGENTIDVPDPSVVVLDVTGLPPDAPRHMVGVQICRLSRAEPLLDALVGDGVEELDDGAAAAMPRTAEELENMANSFRENFREGPLRLELPRRGSYVAVPGVEGPGGRVPLFDAAVRLEITTPGQVLGATIHLDPEKVRAALR